MINVSLRVNIYLKSLPSIQNPCKIVQTGAQIVRRTILAHVFRKKNCLVLKKIFLFAQLFVSNINYKVTANNHSELNISFADIEALAEKEWNDWYEWPTQGFTKDSCTTVDCN